MNFDIAQGIVAKIWTLPNNKRRVFDPQLAHDIAHMLIDEISKSTVDKPEQDKLRDQLASLKDHYNSLNDQYERLKVEHETLQKHQKDLEHVNGNLRHEVNQSKVTIANLQSELDTTKLPKIENKNEVV